MYSKSLNPNLEELTKTWKNRYYRLSDLKPIKLDGTHKNCIWCLKQLSGNRHKWCSNECVLNALAWARPQSAYGLNMLLEKQNFSCAECGISYLNYFNLALSKVSGYSRYIHPRMESKKIDILIRKFRRMIPRDIRPEIDHIVPVSLNGTVIGLENHQILCSQCHKNKTKKDIRKKIETCGSPLKGRKQADAHKNALSKARKGFDSPKRMAHREIMYENMRIKIMAINIETKEELSFNSIKDAADTLDLQITNISRVLRGKQNRKQHKGWTFRFL